MHKISPMNGDSTELIFKAITQILETLFYEPTGNNNKHKQKRSLKCTNQEVDSSSPSPPNSKYRKVDESLREVLANPSENNNLGGTAAFASNLHSDRISKQELFFKGPPHSYQCSPVMARQESLDQRNMAWTNTNGLRRSSSDCGDAVNLASARPSSSLVSAKEYNRSVINIASHIRKLRSQTILSLEQQKTEFEIYNQTLKNTAACNYADTHSLALTRNHNFAEGEVIQLVENTDINVKPENPTYVEPVNTLKERFIQRLEDNWLANNDLQFAQLQKKHAIERKKAEKNLKKANRKRIKAKKRYRCRNIIDNEIFLFDDFPVITLDNLEFNELTAEHYERVKLATVGESNELLITKYKLNITRQDICTLVEHEWMNDEIINFYMNLLTERSEKKRQSHGYPSVYAMSSFFLPRLLQTGHAGVRRWTKSIDIFSKDIILVPVHVANVHWCMAIIHFKNRSIKYYDSMGSPNPNVLNALKKYIEDESLDKNRQAFDTTNFVIESVRDFPRQKNGSDCGVFSCIAAEYITRNKEVTFSQKHIKYFRQKMILEIVQGELLN